MRSRCWLSLEDYSQWLGRLPDESVDLVVSDPPYASLEKHRKTGTTTRLKQSADSSNAWFDVIPNEQLMPLMAELYRVLKKKTHCYMFCDDETSDYLKKAGQDAGFHCWKRLVWSKLAMGMGYHYRASYEFILFFEKGKKPAVPGKVFHGTRQLNSKGTSDILGFKRIRNKEAYPTEKPLELLDVLVRNSTEPGQVVLDPFMGSGVAGHAALQNQRKFWGTDLSPDSFKRTKRRLRPLVRAAKGRY